MSTRKLSDKELDKYFRNILKKPEAVAFDETAWQAMNGKLLASPGGHSMPTWFVISSVITALSLILFLMIQFSGSGATTELSNRSSEFDVTNGSANPVIDTLSKAEIYQSRELLPEDVESLEEKDNFLGVSKSQQSNLDTHVTKRSGISDSPKARDFKAGSSPGSAIKEPFKPSEGEYVESETEKEDRYTSKNGVTRTASNVRGLVHREVETTSQPLFVQRKDILAYEPATELSRDLELKLLTGAPDFMGLEDKEETSRPLLKKFRVGFSLAPDLTTVGELSEFDKAGLDIGVQIEYFLTNRLSITTGALLTRKLYRTTDASEYQVPMGFWTDGVWPEQINADCRVIDIPLNLRYRAIEGPRTQLFVSAGISSYLMLSEVYQYDYPYQNPGNRGPSEFKNENQHYLGVYNLSFGLSRQVSQKVSIEVEPYLKNSLGGVGWGKAQLKSTGALFHFKYHLRTE